MVLRLNRYQLLKLIESIEAGGGDATPLRHELEALGPDRDSRTRTRRHDSKLNEEEEPTLADRLDHRVGNLFADGITNDLLATIIEMDRNYSLKDLRLMCAEVGLSSGGDKKELAAKLIAKGVLGEKLPQTVTPRGTCYEDAWRFLLKADEGELIHGTVLTDGKRIGHAWVELPSGYIWEPQTGQLYKPEAFAIAASPEEESRYTVTEAAIMAARTKNFGPWSEGEVKDGRKGRPE